MPYCTAPLRRRRKTNLDGERIGKVALYAAAPCEANGVEPTPAASDPPGISFDAEKGLIGQVGFIVVWIGGDDSTRKVQLLDLPDAAPGRGPS